MVYSIILLFYHVSSVIDLSPGSTQIQLDTRTCGSDRVNYKYMDTGITEKQNNVIFSTTSTCIQQKLCISRLGGQSQKSCDKMKLTRLNLAGEF